MALYPFKFRAQLLHKIWGGHTIEKWYDHVPADYENVGEAWVISDIAKFPTEVVNGHHAGDSLQDLLEVYMDELVGGKVYDVFGNHFPVLLKFIDAVEDLSIQVHPDDDYALEHEDSLGKTEMWYVMPSHESAAICLGWKQAMNEPLIHEAISDGSLADYVQEYKVKEGDVIFIPTGSVHSMKRNTIVAEIQENSDITYRFYDYNRVGNDGKTRPLQLEKALEVINFEPLTDTNVVSHPMPLENGAVNLQRTPYFTTNLMWATRTIQRDYALLDSFVAYMCVEGECTVKALDSETEQNAVSMHIGEAVLIPAALNDIVITPKGECKLLEIYLEI